MAIDPVSLAITVALTAASMAVTAMQHIEGPRLKDLTATVADYGTPLNYVYGTRRVQGQCFYCEPIVERKKKRKGKGGKMTEYTYHGTWAIVFADHEIQSYHKIWFDSHLVFDSTDGGDKIFELKDDYDLEAHMRLYFGTEDQEPDPRMLLRTEQLHGEGTCPAYLGVAYIFFQGIPLEQIGNRFPQVKGEIAAIDPYRPDIIAGLRGGTSVDYYGNHWGNSYVYQAVSPSGTYTAYSSGVVGNLRSLVVKNERLAYSQIEHVYSEMLAQDVNTSYAVDRNVLSKAFPDDNGNIYASTFDGAKTWKISLSGIPTQIGTTWDIPDQGSVNTNYDMTAIYKVAGVDTLFYAGPVNGPVYVRPLDTGTPVSRAVASTQQTRFFVQDGDENVWALGADYATTPYPGALIDTMVFSCVAGPDLGTSHVVTGMPSIYSSELFSSLQAAYHNGKFYVGWNMFSTDANPKWVVEIDSTTFAVTRTMNINSIIGFTPTTGTQLQSGTGEPMIDTQRNHLIVVKDEYFLKPTTYYRIDLATGLLATDDVDFWPPSANFSNWTKKPPSAAQYNNPDWDPYITYPYALTWNDALGAIVAIPNQLDGADYPTDMAFLFIEDATLYLRDICDDVATRAGMRLDSYDFNSLDYVVKGYSWTNGTGRQILEPLFSVYDCDLRPHNFMVQAVKRHGISQGTLVTADMVPDGSGDKLYTLTRTSDIDLPARLSLTFADFDADQQNNTAVAQRSSNALDNRRAPSIDMGTLALTATDAKQLVDRSFRRSWNARNQAENAATYNLLALEPGDVMTLTFDSTQMVMKCTKVTLRADCVIKLEWEQDNPALGAFGSAVGAAQDGFVPSVVWQPVDTHGEVLDVPLLADLHDSTTPFVYVTAAPSEDGTWPGADFSTSTTGETGLYEAGWAAVPSDYAAVFGAVATALPDANPWVIDDANVVTVIIESGELSNITRDQMITDGTQNIALLGEELIQFQTATLIAPLTYELRGLVRGHRGTEWATAGHGADERFVLLTSAIVRPMGASELGVTRYYIPTTYALTPDEADAFTVLFTGAAHKPYAPIDGSITPSGGDYLIDATRRTRVGGSSLNGQDVPLGEASESWSCDIMDGVTVKRTLTGTSLPLTYTAAQQTTDWGSSWPSVRTAKLYQVSPAFNLRGYPLTITNT